MPEAAAAIVDKLGLKMYADDAKRLMSDHCTAIGKGKTILDVVPNGRITRTEARLTSALERRCERDSTCKLW